MFETRFDRSNTIYKNLLIIKGLGHYKIDLICKALGINPNLKLRNLSKTHTNRLYSLLSKIKKQVSTDIIPIEHNIYIKDTNHSQIPIIRSYQDLNKSDNLLFLINLQSNYHISPYKSNSIHHILNSMGEKNEKKKIYLPVLLIDESLEEYEKNNILNLVKTNSYRGRRLKLGYPSRGQRTRTNAKTARKLNRKKFQKK